MNHPRKGTVPYFAKKLLRFFKIAPQDILLGIAAVVVSLAVISISTYIYFAKDLTTKDALMNRNNTGVILLDRNGKVFFNFNEAQYKEFVPLSKIPLITQEAIIATEDKDFYSHPGFSIKSMIGAFIADLKRRDADYGGSTITQQLVKNSLLNPKKSFTRKFQEIILAQEVERRFNKKEILEMYLNSVYFGEGAFGIEAASQTYFGKDVSQLNLAEASLLAGLLTAPSELSPYSGNQSLVKQRQDYVLSEMVQQKYITQQQKNETEKQPVALHKVNQLIPYAAPHFALMVRDELNKKYGEENVARSGFVVKTTIDLDWQAYAEKVVKDQVQALARNRVSNGAAVVMDPQTGEIKALVGSVDWNNDQFGKVNITTSLRQPGSSFKPIIYADALEKKLITPATVLKDTPTTFGGKYDTPYKPKDYDGKYRGNVLVRRALANSLNIPAVEVMEKVGVADGIAEAQKFGITTLSDDPSNYGLSMVLGAAEVKLLDMTDAYSVFASGGYKVEPTTILSIVDKANNPIYTYKPQPKQVLDPGVAYQIASILSDNHARQEEFGNALTTPIGAAVKTGTTEDYRDSLTMGFTNNLTVGVWVGNNDGTLMDNVAGSLGAAPIWKSLITKFSDGKPVKFTPPSDIVSLNVCSYNGLKVREATSSGYTEYFLPGTEPTGYCYVPKPSPSPDQSNSSQSPAPTQTPPPAQPTSDSVQQQINQEQQKIQDKIEKVREKIGQKK